MKVKMACVLIILAALALAFHSTGYSQDTYPNQPVQIVTPHSPGGGVDRFFRLLSEELTNHWKLQVNVLNKRGGGGVTAASEVTNAKKDGYTVLGVLVGKLSAMTAADPEGPVNFMRDFDPVYVNYGYAAVIMVVNSKSEFKSLEDVIAYAKKHPGKLVAGAGMVGTGLNMNGLLVNKLANIDITILPTKGPGETNPMVLGEHVDLGYVSDVSALSYVKAGQMRVLATDIKSPVMPDVPTYREKGYPLDLISSLGVFGPKGLPSEVMGAWENAIKAVLKKPSFIASTKKAGLSIHNALMGRETLDNFLKKELEIYSGFTHEELGWKK
jgi:tripartite-type tricarboxylate transporter receptor subunit TctC